MTIDDKITATTTGTAVVAAAAAATTPTVITELVVFDFDETIVDCNSDTFINELAPDGGHIPDELYAEFLLNNRWTEYMAKVLGYLHSRGVRELDLRQCLKRMPFLVGMKDLITKLSATSAAAGPAVAVPVVNENNEQRNYELIIISDANSVFIGHYLEFNQLDKAFRNIYTNPATFDDTGCLKLTEYQYQNWCTTCARNLCKGHVLEEHIKRRAMEDNQSYSRISYVGDGSNDVCPALRLGPNDRVFARHGYPLDKRLANNADLKAKRYQFNNANDISAQMF
ncbi:probable phosphatase phospho2 [Oppia nitens]|uniref:probable phosphatase phospho2 n=1 Tax=Oppia nitens TaxID=1686743 RepID=UPI0023DA3D3E|nr:probable phosphatase phospho2 [Oppia nitens]XP_054163378.1 probable phosphatase phospho2 [Oppia nitens]XP_054163386.1 probable phosphatase phospho2 [Oppia nitens]XP_054163394.1 probable phosphatase phospho2 [Oppia nitens]XP_054163401.1 probable phosphatase phospho2 [Oppia nitens]